MVNGSGTSNVQMTLLGGGGQSPPDTGTIFTQDTTNNPSGMAGIAAHETGHLMGLRDLYVRGQAVPLNANATADATAQPTNSPLTASWVLRPQNGNGGYSNPPDLVAMMMLTRWIIGLVSISCMAGCASTATIRSALVRGDQATVDRFVEDFLAGRASIDRAALQDEREAATDVVIRVSASNRVSQYGVHLVSDVFMCLLQVKHRLPLATSST